MQHGWPSALFQWQNTDPYAVSPTLPPQLFHKPQSREEYKKVQRLLQMPAISDVYCFMPCIRQTQSTWAYAGGPSLDPPVLISVTCLLLLPFWSGALVQSGVDLSLWLHAHICLWMRTSALCWTAERHAELAVGLLPHRHYMRRNQSMYMVSEAWRMHWLAE